MEKERIIFIDYLRVIACFMVMLVHSCEPFYLGGQGTYILNRTDAIWVTAIDSLLRCCVPLFVMASSYLLFPLKEDSATFFRKRFRRVAVPFMVWLVLYSVIPMYGSMYDFYKTGSVLANLKQCLLNFPGAAGHLWFVFMLLGIYLVMPLLSPWAEKVSRKAEGAFLGVWLFTTLVPFLRLLSQHIGGLPEIWGEANWNEFGMLYGVSGFIGYVVLGHYFRTWVGDLCWKRTLAIAVPSILAGYALSAGWFWAAMPKTFPVDAPVDLAVMMEKGWNFCSIGVALVTLGMFLIIRKFNSTGLFYEYFVRPVAGASYGMYLMHIFFLCFYSAVLREAVPSTPAVIVLTAVCSYLTSFCVSWCLAKIPKLGRYIAG